MIHELKTWPQYFDDVISGKKTFEVRKDDRDFRIGDTLYLKKYDPERGYTGDWAYADVTSLLRGGNFGIALDYVVMSIKLGTTSEKSESENPGKPWTIEDRINSIEICLDTVWTEIFSAGTGSLKHGDNKFRTTLKGTVDDLCTKTEVAYVSAPWSVNKPKTKE